MIWEHPVEVMRIKMLGKEPHCRTCRGYMKGSDQQWCPWSKNNPNKFGRMSDSTQVCERWHPPES